LVIGLDNLIVTVALPTLVRDLDASTSELQWIVDAYLLAVAGLMLVGGSLGDRFGRAKVLRLGLVVFGIASVFAAFSPDATALTLCRAVMGLGAALIMPTSVAIVANVFTDPKERGRALGVWSAVVGLGLALGPVLGGVLLSQFWWGSVFFVNVPIVAVALAVSWWAVPESRNPDLASFDPLGVLLSILGVSALVWATIEAPSHGWGSTTTLTSFAIAAVLLACFVTWELGCTHPMLEMRFFRNPRFSVANLVSAIANFAFAGMLFVLTQLLQLVFGYSPLRAGLALVPFAAAYMAGALVGPRFAERIGTKRAVAMGLGIFAVGLGMLATSNAHSAYGVVVIATLAMGVGCGAVHAPTTDAVVGSVPREQAGIASGTLSTGRSISLAMGVAVIGSLLVSGFRSALATHTGGFGLSSARLSEASASLGGALGVAHRLGGTAGDALHDAANAAFIHGMRLGLAVGAALVGLAAILAVQFLPARAHDVLGPEEVQRVAALDAIVMD
jgi:EmrB/QacA subfamily drug resistance transporter